jgi:hypothetical protein
VLIRQLQLPLVPVEVVTDYRVGDRIHRRLRGYKDATVAEARVMHAATLARQLGEWVTNSGHRVRREPWDWVVTVPSTRRPVGSPVDVVVDRVPSLAPHRLPLLGRGPEPTGHLRAARAGFVVNRAVLPRGREGRFLVVDDTLTTGARAQSAAATLRLAGLPVVGVVVLGRTVGAVGPARPGQPVRCGPGRSRPVPGDPGAPMGAGVGAGPALG